MSKPLAKSEDCAYLLLRALPLLRRARDLAEHGSFAQTYARGAISDVKSALADLRRKTTIFPEKD